MSRDEVPPFLSTGLPPTLTPELQEGLAAVLRLQAADQGAALKRLLDDHVEHADQLRALFLLGGPRAERAVPAPQRIGNYRVLRQLGEGGMGMVYLAEQEHPIRRTVALKLLRHGLITEEAKLRFAAERQALALLDHPNIARVLDSGTADDGRPFFAMDYVPGEPITAYCARADLDLDGRLRLFVEVCRGVHHAHLRGIIHRDLKPSNVLVQENDGRAAARIIDFGIAKAVDHKLVDATLHTELGRIIGTPEYMSPEQADPATAVIDVRSDVYSLGVLLYELLTGELPLPSAELRVLNLPAMVQRIREHVPVRPSARATTKIGGEIGNGTSAWLRRIRGDLDWVTLRAVEKDPDRRYQSAASLADDVERFLQLRPVEAGPPGALYRLRRFCRRNRVPVGAGAAVLLAILGGAIGMGWLAVESSRLADAALHHAGQAEDLATFMMVDLRDRLRPLGRLDLLEAVAGKAKDYYDSRVAAELAVPAAASRAAALRNLAEVLQAQGRLADALELQERARGIVVGNGGDPLSLSACDVALASLRQDLGELDLAAAAADRAVASVASARLQPNCDRALAAAHECRARVRRAAGDLSGARGDWLAAVAAFENAGPAHEDRLIGALLGLAELDGAQGRTDAACAAHARARVLIDASLRSDPGNGRLLFLRAHVATRDGGVLAASGRSKGARAQLEEAEQTLANLVERDPGNNDWRAELALARARLAEVLLADGDSARAERLFSGAVAIGRWLVEQRPDHEGWRASLADCLFHLSETTRHRGDLGAARALMGEAEEHAMALVARDSLQAEWQRLLGVVRYELGRMAAIAGLPAEAVASYQRAAATQEALSARDPTAVDWQADLVNTRLALGSEASKGGDCRRASAEFAAARTALQTLRELQPDELRWLRTLAACDQLSASAASRAGDHQDALRLNRQAVSIRRQVVVRAPDHPALRRELALALLTLGDALIEGEATAEAVAATAEAVDVLDENCRRDPDNASWSRLLSEGLTRLGYAHQALGDTVAALAAFDRGLEISGSLLARDPDNLEWQQSVAHNTHLVADQRFERGEMEAALRGYLRADELFRARCGALPGDRVAVCDLAVNAGRLGMTLEELARAQEARAWFLSAAEPQPTRLKEAAGRLGRAVVSRKP